MRNAIVYANSTVGIKDTITFNIPGTGPFAIQPSTPLPSITDPVIIDGYSQPGSVRATSSVPANLLIELDGSLGVTIGLNILSGNCEIRGLIINSFNEIDIQLLGPNGGNTIEGNYIGINANGNAKGINVIGIRVDNCPDNIIGGDNLENRNIISASGGLEGAYCLVFIDLPQSTGNVVKGNYLGVGPNGSAKVGESIVGVRINAGAHHNTVGPNNIISGNSLAGIQMEPGFSDYSNHNIIIGNLIGTNKDGNSPIPNGNGIRIFNGPNNTIGGVNPWERNIISGNAGAGVEIIFDTYDAPSGNMVIGNFIGVNAAGTGALGNGGYGIHLYSRESIIGGIDPAERNIISGNNSGIFIENVGSTGNKIIGNYIGTTSDGLSASGNINHGIYINGAPGNFIGGVNPGEGNTISSNQRNGIHLEGTDISGNKIEGNLIGTNSLGIAPLGNNQGVHIDGSGITVGGTSSGSRNIISGNNVGILMGEQSSNNTIQGNYIGTDPSGTSAVQNMYQGIAIEGAKENLVGGTTPEARNLISGNGTYGIFINNWSGNQEVCFGNIIKGNFIGLNAAGNEGLGNGDDGIRIDARDNIIGGLDAGSGNVISGNKRGILIISDKSTGNVVQGNLIGANADGSEAVGNLEEGIRIEDGAKNNIVGPNNIISGNTQTGVRISGTGTEGNKVIGNLIGTEKSGKLPLPNGEGINVGPEAKNTQLGGESEGTGNIIAFNTWSGFLLGGSNNFIEGNEIFKNNGNAIDLVGSNNIIGGSQPGSRNYIYGNGNGINSYPQADSNRIEGNYIGLDRSGKQSESDVMDGVGVGGSDNLILKNIVVGHKSNGILISRWASETSPNPNPIPQRNLVEGNIVGMNGSLTEKMPNGHGVSINTGVNTKIVRNIIAGNLYNGISMGDQFFEEGDPYQHSNGTLISENSIYDNGQLGIDLNMDWVTENDDGDTDTGPNNLQNFPVIDNLNFTSNSVSISGHLNSLAYKEYTLEFFASKVAENTGYGEGRTYLGSEIVSTTNSSNVNFAVTFPRSTGWGDVITATATDSEGNTSEFSMAVGGTQDQIISAPMWPFHFVVNEVGIPRITNGTDITAVRESFNTWEAIPTAIIDFVDDGTTPQKYGSATDGINLVSFIDDKYPFPPRVLAIAAKTLRVIPGSEVTEIIDADILVNPMFVAHDVGVGYGTPNEGFYDDQSIITHEIGHVLGLLHTGVVKSTMFPYLNTGTDVRSLEQDDRSWASYKYQRIPDYSNSFGSLSGRILYGEDDSHPPVAGALMLAINNATGDSIHAFSDADGNYLIPGLPTGSYNIFAQPLDGDVNGFNIKPGNISTYIYSNTIYMDYPGEYLSVDESDRETEDIPLSVGVTAGSDYYAGDIITNKDITGPNLVSIRPTDVSDDRIRVLSNFIITFSEAVDMESFTAETCYLDAGDGNTIGGSFSTLADSLNIIIFNPASILNFGTEYTIILTNGITDVKGNPLSFPLPGTPPVVYAYTTVDPDLLAPKINSTSPLNGAVNVYVTARINVFFSEPMDHESVNENFSLTWNEGDPAVTKTAEGTISWDSEFRNLTFTPLKSLNEGTAYILGVTTGAMDLSGNNLGQAGNYTFNTVTESAPTIVDYGPSAGQPGVTIETPVVVDFSEPVDPSSVSSFTFILRAAGEQLQIEGDFEFLNGNSRVVFRPDDYLAYSKTYSVLLTTGIRDVSLTVRNLEADYIWKFTTASVPVAPSILFIDPPRAVEGSVITISGSGFDPDPARNQILFNGIPAYAQTASLSTLTTKVPMGAVSGPVTVTVSGKVSNEMQFYLVPQYINEPNYVVSNKSLGSGSTGGADIGGTGEAVFALVTNPDGNSVTRIGLGSQAGDAISINVGQYPLRVDIDPEEKRAYITNFNSHDVSVIDLSSNTVINTIAVGIEPFGVVVTPDGKRVYVANYFSGNLSMIDVDPNSGGFDHVVANVSTGTNSREVTATADAGLVLATGDFGLKIINSDPEDQNYNTVIANVSSGTKTGAVTVTADAGFAIVATLEGSLLIVDLHPENDDYTNAVVANVPTGTKVSDVKASADAIYIYATDTENGQILVYKISRGGSSSSSGSNTETITLIPQDPITNVGSAPAGLSVSSYGNIIYVITGNPENTAERRVTSISLTGGIISPEESIESLIITVQNLIKSGNIPKLRGAALIVLLNSSLRNLNNDRIKLAIVDLVAFNALVKTYIKNKQISAVQGNALIAAATSVINQLRNTKGEEEFDLDNIAGDKSFIEPVLETRLCEIYPNPSSNAFTIDYEIDEDQLNGNKVSLQVFDITGRIIGNLVNDNRETGRYSVTWTGQYEDGSFVPLGVYYIRFTAGSVKEVRRVMLIR